MDACGGGNNIGDGVDGTDLMKGDLLGGKSVNLPLGDGNTAKDGEAALLYLRRKGAFFQNVPNLGKTAAVSMAVLVGVWVLVRMGGGAVMVSMNLEFPAGDIAAFAAMEVSMELVLQTNALQCIKEDGFLHSQVPKGTNRHVAADTGKAIEIESLHLKNEEDWGIVRSATRKNVKITGSF